MPLVIEGGHPLVGMVDVEGAKNAALPIIAATLLTADECLLENVPFIEDIRVMLKVLHHLGVAARFEGPNTLRIKATRISKAFLPPDLAKAMRASFLVVGPLLSRFGQAEAPHPGGCSIGTRPVSVDLRGFQHMGADISMSEINYVIRAPGLHGERLILDYPSHTGTENVIMAACLAQGVTTIENASIEPEVADLIAFLCAMGARISGAGTNTLQIEGTGRLHGACFRVMPDRMVAGTYALGALISGGDVTMSGVVAPYLGALTNKLQEAGAEILISHNEYRVRYAQPLRAVDIQTYPYPGFPTDLQAPFTTVMTQAQGTSSTLETMFDGRLQYVEQLRVMGAEIEVHDNGRRATVHGPTKLRGSDVQALDIRSGAAMVMAGLAAEGKTSISNVAYIDRGYQDLDKRLIALGAVISRSAEEEHCCPQADADEPVEWSPVGQLVG